ncbi:hypothetical protein ABPG72_012258 [Tetrahymena utriculariae]
MHLRKVSAVYFVILGNSSQLITFKNEQFVKNIVLMLDFRVLMSLLEDKNDGKQNSKFKKEYHKIQVYFQFKSEVVTDYQQVAINLSDPLQISWELFNQSKRYSIY